jgi:hypothetical protein
MLGSNDWNHTVATAANGDVYAGTTFLNAGDKLSPGFGRWERFHTYIPVTKK